MGLPVVTCHWSPAAATLELTFLSGRLLLLAMWNCHNCPFQHLRAKKPGEPKSPVLSKKLFRLLSSDHRAKSWPLFRDGAQQLGWESENLPTANCPRTMDNESSHTGGKHIISKILFRALNCHENSVRFSSESRICFHWNSLISRPLKRNIWGTMKRCFLVKLNFTGKFS